MVCGKIKVGKKLIKLKRPLISNKSVRVRNIKI